MRQVTRDLTQAEHECQQLAQPQRDLQAHIRRTTCSPVFLFNFYKLISVMVQSWYHFYAGVRNELGKLEDVNNQMLLKLREHSRHAHAAVLWLRNNKEQFRGKIHEPIMTVVRASFNTCRVSIG